MYTGCYLSVKTKIIEYAILWKLGNNKQKNQKITWCI